MAPQIDPGSQVTLASVHGAVGDLSFTCSGQCQQDRDLMCVRPPHPLPGCTLGRSQLSVGVGFEEQSGERPGNQPSPRNWGEEDEDITVTCDLWGLETLIGPRSSALA